MEALRFLAKVRPELLSSYQETKGQYARIFLLNDKLNENKWRATWNAIKKDAKEFINKPTILTPDFDHTYSSTYEQGLQVQKKYKNGEIIDVVFDDGSHTAWAIVKVDSETWEKIQAKVIQYVSPALWPKTSKDVEIVDLGYGVHEHIVHRFLALHLAFVDDPAYGRIEAFVDDTCDGTNSQCMMSLNRQMSSSLDNSGHSFITLAPILVKTANGSRYAQVPDCVQRLIQEKTEIGTEITEDLLKTAYDECKETHSKCGCSISDKLALIKLELDILNMK